MPRACGVVIDGLVECGLARGVAQTRRDTDAVAGGAPEHEAAVTGVDGDLVGLVVVAQRRDNQRRGPAGDGRAVREPESPAGGSAEGDVDVVVFGVLGEHTHDMVAVDDDGVEWAAVLCNDIGQHHASFSSKGQEKGQTTATHVFQQYP